MITYEYQRESCQRQFEFRQAITEQPIVEGPECHEKLSLMVSGGSGVMIKGGSQEWQHGTGNSCSFESSGQTCCGQTERCGKPPCGTRS
jgi:putative FmdB family regulatory protein